MYIKRDMEDVFLKISSQFRAVMLTGPRQVGKTTMLQKLMEGTERTYVSLDDLEVRALAKNEPAMFFQRYKTPILIDEVQYAPELFPYIKMMADKNKIPGEFWLTGSQIWELMRGVQESLAGRIAILKLTPLSQNEIYNKLPNTPFDLDFERLISKQEKTEKLGVVDAFERIFTGGMPSVVSGAEDRRTFYSSYTSSYIERDVKELSQSINSLSFMKFMIAVAARISQLVNHADIARDCDIDQVTVKNWLNILETLGIIFYLHPYSNNTLKRLIKTPKLYFYDSGLAAYLTKWSDALTLEAGAMNGAFFENYVVSEIFKSFYNSGRETYFYYYRDKDAKEIDFIFEENGTLYPMEIKKSANPSNHLTRVFKLLNHSNKIRGTGAVLCMANTLSAFSKDELIVPISLI